MHQFKYGFVLVKVINKNLCELFLGLAVISDNT